MKQTNHDVISMCNSIKEGAYAYLIERIGLISIIPK